MIDDIVNVQKPSFFASADCIHELFVQLVGQQRNGKLAKVKFQDGRHGVNVLHVNFLGQVRNFLGVKFQAQALNIR